MNTAQRVVITGLAALTPLGSSLEATWQAMCQGRSGIGPITQFDASAYGCRIAGEVSDFSAEGYVDFKEAKRMARFSLFSVVAAKMLLENAGLDPVPGGDEGLGCLLGTGMGELGLLEAMHERMIKMGTRRISPFLISAIGNMAPGSVSIHVGARGINLAVTSACASGLHAVFMARDEISQGRIDAAICGGVESNVAPLAIAGFDSLRVLSRRNDEPHRASRPFDRDSDGFVMSEGCGLLLLESLDRAKARGANILAEVLGCGASSDAHDWTGVPEDGAGLQRAMRGAMAEAGVEPQDLDVVFANGLSNPVADLAETRAIKAVLGKRAWQVPVTALKSMIGHLIGAAGGVQAACMALTLTRGTVPPTINLDEPAQECDLDYTAHTARQGDFRTGLATAFGFGGVNAAVVMRRYEE